MSNLFLSHSHKDKLIVEKIAIDLLGSDIPVWYDSWKLKPGDSLLKEVFSAIDKSGIVVLVLTENSVKSDWVERELNASLAKENDTDATILIPVLVSECEIPLVIRDRIYADFTSSYINGINSLKSVIKSHGLTGPASTPEEELLPLTFSHGVHLITRPLVNRLETIRPTLPSDFEFTPDQLVIKREAEYLELWSRADYRLDNLTKDTFYSPEFEKDFLSKYNKAKDLEAGLREGLSIIINNVALKNLGHVRNWEIPCEWFSKLCRANLLGRLYFMQSPNEKNVIGLGEEYIGLTERELISKLFKVDTLQSCDVYKDVPGNELNIWLNANSSLVRRMGQYIPVQLYGKDIDTLSKYVIPQMIWQFINGRIHDLTWEFEDHWAGLP